MTETEKVVIMREGCAYLARVWQRNFAPVTVEEPVFVDGNWVCVTIKYDETRGGRKPARRAGDAASALEAER